MLVLWDNIKMNTKDETGGLLLSYTMESGHETVVKSLVAGTMSRWTPRTVMAICHCCMLQRRGMKQW